MLERGEGLWRRIVRESEDNMKKTYVVAIVVLVIAGLFGTFIGANTNIPLYVSDPGYRFAVALENEYPFADIWEFRSDGEFIYVSVLWLETPSKEVIREFADVVEEFIVDYRTDERRVIFKDIIVSRPGVPGGYAPTYTIVQILSCEADLFGLGKPIPCQIWPWPLQTKPERYPWAGPTSIWK